ncbi:MAG: hypothetical protein ACI8ZM_004237 [Crocinitomix sp.]|jgi:hypothetical protein
MKYILNSLLLFVICTPLYTQNIPVAFGGGEYQVPHSEDNCLSEEDRLAIRSQLRINVEALRTEGKLNFSGDREDVKFIWPLQKAAGFEWNSYYGIANYVDQTPGPELGDYYCNERTYNGHKGTDIFTWPFPWYMYENNLVEVIAGEEGVIINKADGFEDDHCECLGSWNAIYVQHADGSVAWYGHLKSGSLTDKEVGDAVDEGEYLGVVASSGCSTGPHLHLEVYDGDGNLIDPYAGDCNDINLDSWWETQDENREPTLNTILTHDTVPEHGCPLINEDPHMSNDFYSGDEIFTAFYFHDGLDGTEFDCRIKMPDGTVWNDWSYTIGITLNASWWYWSWYLPTEGPNGVWTLEADYEGETIVHEFNYGVYAGVNELDDSDIKIIPNPANSNLIQISGIPIENKIEFYDAAGKQIKSVSNRTLLEVGDIAPGLYYVTVYFADGSTVVKTFVKN